MRCVGNRTGWWVLLGEWKSGQLRAGKEPNPSPAEPGWCMWGVKEGGECGWVRSAGFQPQGPAPGCQWQAGVRAAWGPSFWWALLFPTRRVAGRRGCLLGGLGQLSAPGPLGSRAAWRAPRAAQVAHPSGGPQPELSARGSCQPRVHAATDPRLPAAGCPRGRAGPRGLRASRASAGSQLLAASGADVALHDHPPGRGSHPHYKEIKARSSLRWSKRKLWFSSLSWKEAALGPRLSCALRTEPSEGGKACGGGGGAGDPEWPRPAECSPILAVLSRWRQRPASTRSSISWASPSWRARRTSPSRGCAAGGRSRATAFRRPLPGTSCRLCVPTPRPLPQGPTKAWGV